MRPSAIVAAAALLVGVAIGLGAARALPTGPARRAAEPGAASVPARAGEGRAGSARPATGRGADTGARGGGPAPEAIDAGGLGDEVAAIVLEEVRAALAATATPDGASPAERGAGRISGRVRAVDGAPLAGVTIEARRVPEPLPAPSEDAARRIALEGRPADAGIDIFAALERDVRLDARALVRRRARAPVAVTGPDGAYEIAGLAPGRHEVAAEARGWSLRPRVAEGALEVLLGEMTVEVGGAAGAVTLDWTARREARVRFEAAGPGGAAVSHLVVEVRDQGRWRQAPAGGSAQDLELPPGLHVADATGEAPGATPDAPPRTLSVSAPFVVASDAAPQTIALRFGDAPDVKVTVVSDDPETEDWDRVRVVVRPEGSAAGDGVAWARLPDGTRGLEMAPRDKASGDPTRRVVTLPPLAAGLYGVEARRLLEPPEEPGPRAALVVREGAPSLVEARLPPSGRAVRIAVRVEGLPGDSEGAHVGLLRRARGQDVLIAAGTAMVAEGEDGAPPEARFALRPVDVVEPGGAPSLVVAFATSGDTFEAEAPVPRGRDVTVALRMPGAASLTLEVDGSAMDDSDVVLDALIATPEGKTADVAALPTLGRGARREARFRAVGAGTYAVLVTRRGGGAAVPVAEARVTLAPGENALSLTLPTLSAARIRPDRAGALVVYAAAPEGLTGLSVHHLGDVEAGASCALPPLPPGVYVAAIRGARDPFAAEGAPRDVAAMAFRLPEAGPEVPFAPAAPEGFSPRLLEPRAPHLEAGLCAGDLLVTIDGVAPADPWEPLSPLLDAPPREPDLSRVTVLRDGAPVTIDLWLTGLRAARARGGFAPVPGGR